MSVSKTHLFRQGPVIRTLLKTAFSSMAPANKNRTPDETQIPGPVLEQIIEPRNPRLVGDFIHHLGGQLSTYKGFLPPHLFPQWGFPLMAKTLEGLPYKLNRLLNGGCRFEVVHPLPCDQRLLLKAQLVELDDNGYRVFFKQKLITGTEKNPESIIAYVHAVLPIKRSDGPKKEKASVPLAAREIDTWKLFKNSGLEFALLTGDFNPVHWVPGYARISGFPNTIMHGFATMARTVETLNRSLFVGQPNRLTSFESRLVKPLVFPGQAKVYLDGTNTVFVGNAPGGPAYLTGIFTTR